MRDHLKTLLAVASIATGVMHAFAFRDHTHHPLVATFFAAAAIAQIGWAFALVLWPKARIVLVAGLANTGVVATWVISRTTGLPFAPGAEARESIGRLDAISTLLESGIVAALLYLLMTEGAVRRFVPRELATGVLAMGFALVALPGALGTPTGSHSHVAADRHAHGPLASGHGHDEREGHTHAGDDTQRGGHGGDNHDGSPPHASGGAHVHGVSATPHDTHASPDHDDATSKPKPRTVASAKPRGQRASVRYGPFDIPPARADGTPGVAAPIQTMLQPPCRHCFLTAMEPDLVFGDGSDANYNTGVMLHHVVVGDSGEPDVTCGRRGTGSVLGRRFFAAGNERTPSTLPAPYGYRVDAQDWWTGAFEFMNFTNTRKSVYVKVTVHHLPATDTSVKKVTPVWLDMNNCGNSQYSIPAGYRKDTWSWTSTITGRMVWAAGHVHNWGLKTTLTNPDAGQHMCTSVAGYGTDPAYMGNIDSMSVCAWDKLGTVRNGERLQITAVYDSPQARSDVMAIMVAFVYETSDLSGGSQAPEEMTDPPEGPPPEDPSDEHQH